MFGSKSTDDILGNKFPFYTFQNIAALAEWTVTLITYLRTYFIRKFECFVGNKYKYVNLLTLDYFQFSTMKRKTG